MGNTEKSTNQHKTHDDLKKEFDKEHDSPSESANNYSRGSNVSGVAADDEENWSRDQVEGDVTGQREVLKAAARIENLKEDSNSRNTKMDEESPRGEKVKGDKKEN